MGRIAKKVWAFICNTFQIILVVAILVFIAVLFNIFMELLLRLIFGTDNG